ncbi:hypothetical protein CHS0354_041742 [Potamilus streckersoni]|uniref:Uncharacterized protein n=1 Tax=Potamilus streckersoni TaxID=2493646 RepID=A0AAE0T224_9BIVA|nr:hypothetical protein CHS0354_041742 [Potamilus streckersoni]
MVNGGKKILHNWFTSSGQQKSQRMELNALHLKAGRDPQKRTSQVEFILIKDMLRSVYQHDEDSQKVGEYTDMHESTEELDGQSAVVKLLQSLAQHKNEKVYICLAPSNPYIVFGHVLRHNTHKLQACSNDKWCQRVGDLCSPLSSQELELLPITLGI